MMRSMRARIFQSRLLESLSLELASVASNLQANVFRENRMIATEMDRSDSFSRDEHGVLCDRLAPLYPEVLEHRGSGESQVMNMLTGGRCRCDVIDDYSLHPVPPASKPPSRHARTLLFRQLPIANTNREY